MTSIRLLTMALTKPGHNWNGRPVKIDPKAAFDCWIEAGTRIRAMRLYKELYGVKCSESGLAHATRLYILRNPEEARKVFTADVNMGDYWKDDDNWYKKLISYAIQVHAQHSRARDGFLNWIEENDLEGYSSFYLPRINSNEKFVVKDIPP